MTSGILLAAGAGRRFGSQKLLADLGGTRLVCRTVAACVGSRLDEIVVVTGPDAAVREAIRGHFDGEPRIRFEINEAPERGAMSSVKTALRSLRPDVAAAVVILGDMPMVPPNLIDELIIEQAWHGGIVVPVCQGEWRHPRVIPAALFEDFLALADDDRGTKVIERYRADVKTVEVGSADTFMDINSVEDVVVWRRANEVER